MTVSEFYHADKGKAGTWYRFVGSHVWLITGLFLLALGIALTLRANVGVAPWDVFHSAVWEMTPLSYGRVTQAVGLCVILLGFLLRVMPSLATVLNMILIGEFIDLVMPHLPQPASLVGRSVEFVLGLLVVSLGIAFYLSADLGGGPRDNMMLGFTRLTGRSVGLVRAAMDTTITLIGWWLGGRLGAGTVVIAFSTGPLVEFWFYRLQALSRLPFFEYLVHVPADAGIDDGTEARPVADPEDDEPAASTPLPPRQLGSD